MMSKRRNALPLPDELKNPNPQIIMSRKKSSIDLPLPDEITEMILLRLPAFDLVSCKGVCKAWRSLISSAGFVSAHLERSKSDPLQSQLLVYNRKKADVDAPFSSFICFSSTLTVVVGSINGLICIVGPETGPMRPDDIWILNPVTGLSMKLPYSSNSPRLIEEFQKVMFAFWCDCDDDDDGDSAVVYKVAKIVSNIGGASMLEVWVSTSPDTWSVISTFEFQFSWWLRPVHCCDVLIEQGPAPAAYWIVLNDKIDVYVASLDFKTLRLEFSLFSKRRDGLINLAALYSKSNTVDVKCVLFGGNLNGELVLITYNSSDHGLYYDVWTMVKDGGWMKKFTICFNSLPFEECSGRAMRNSYKSIECLRMMNDKLIFTSLDGMVDGMVLGTYDLVTGKLKVLEEPASKLETIWMVSTHGFVGSLVSLDGFESNHLSNLDIIQMSWLSSLPMGRRLKRCVRKRELRKKISSMKAQFSNKDIIRQCYEFADAFV